VWEFYPSSDEPSNSRKAFTLLWCGAVTAKLQ
jgi:hypothetical protein